MSLPQPPKTKSHNPVEGEILSFKEFSKVEDLFQIEINHKGKKYFVNIAEVFDTDIDYNSGTINEISANSIMNYMLAIRNGFNTIIDNQTGELDEAELAFEFFMAEKNKIIEKQIIEERAQLVADKKKKDIGMITQQQIKDCLILSYYTEYHEKSLKIKTLERSIKNLEKLDRILAHRIDRLNDMLTRQRKTIGN